MQQIDAVVAVIDAVGGCNRSMPLVDAVDKYNG